MGKFTENIMKHPYLMVTSMVSGQKKSTTKPMKNAVCPEAGWLGLVAGGGALIGSSGHPQVDGPGDVGMPSGACCILGLLDERRLS